MLKQEFRHRRLTQLKFPEYAFVPGKNPHPTADPSGHSFNQIGQPQTPITESNWHSHTGYLYGCDLFNHGFWWEAHESWEQVWMASRGNPITDAYLRALIQAANGLLKLYMGRYNAVRRLATSVTELMTQSELDNAVYLGLDVGLWLPIYQAYTDSKGSTMAPFLVLKLAPDARLEH